ncbi:MAG: TerB family tellurite resistance protein [Myxococcales bacterium]|nr:TerB family tellurite resistance protein [Myxococcales bacterium]
MPLSPEQEWTLAACGLVAHADEILEVDEWDRVLWMLDDRIAGDDATEWTELLADADRLRQHLDTLAPPPPLFSEEILEKAWRMALADGEGSEQEARVHDELARRLGVPAEEVAGLRARWLEQAQRRSELVAGFAAIVANLDGRLDPSEAAELDALLDRLPVADGRQPALEAMRDEPPALDEIVGALLGSDAEERRIALWAIVPLVRASARGERERALFLDVASRLAISDAEAERMLDR